MKFELTDKDLKVVDGKYVQLPMARFAALAEYVEDLEDRLLAVEVNLRESERVGAEMEQMTLQPGEQEPLAPDDAQQLQSILQRLEPAELEKRRKEKKISIRQLAVKSGIPYATLHRYLKRPDCPLKVKDAKGIKDALDLYPGLDLQLKYNKTTRQWQKPGVEVKTRW